jgi:hypothetical protein
MNSFEREVSASDPGQVSQDTVQDERRREAMRRMAKYAAPAMLAMLIAEKAVAQDSFLFP